MLAAIFSSNRERNKNIRKLNHGTASTEGTVSFNVNEIKSSLKKSDQKSAKEFLNHEECISVENTITDHMSKAYLFSYWINNASKHGYQPEQVVVISKDQKEANEKFYKWICEVYEFKEIQVSCEELGIL